MKEPALAAKLIWKRRRQWLATILRKAPFRRCGARWPLSGHVAIRASPAGALATRQILPGQSTPFSRLRSASWNGRLATRPPDTLENAHESGVFLEARGRTAIA
jgi:hypothetical protein